MIAFLFGLAFTILIVALFNIPRVLIAKRNRKLAEAKLDITRCVTELQQYMRNGDLCCGEYCHDWLSIIMQHSQFFTRYGTLSAIVRTPRCEFVRMLDRMDAEISRKPKGYQIIVDRFFMAYAKALRYRQPITFSVFIGVTIIRILIQHMQVTRRNIAEAAARIAVVSSDPDPIPA